MHKATETIFGENSKAYLNLLMVVGNSNYAWKDNCYDASVLFNQMKQRREIANHSLSKELHDTLKEINGAWNARLEILEADVDDIHSLNEREQRDPAMPAFNGSPLHH